MKPLLLPVSALLIFALPIASFAQSYSSSSMSSMSSSLSSMSTMASSMSSKSSSRTSSSRMSSAVSVGVSAGAFAGVDFEDVDLSRYSDAPWDQATNVAVSALTEIGVLLGNDDGTYAPERFLNRAEYVTIVMRLLNDNRTIATNCFPDIKTSDWFAEDVCRAKFAGLVRGNAVAGVDEDLWKFEPARAIQYEEAVKILAQLYALPVIGDTEGADWYVPYLQAAEARDLDLEGLRPGDNITRGEMALLTAAFTAEAEGRLDELYAAEGMTASMSSRTSSSRSSSRSSSSRSSSSTDTSIDVPIKSSILLLGETSPTLAGIKLFSDLEPVDIEELTIELVDPVESILSMVVFDESGGQLATATSVIGSTTAYRAIIPVNNFHLPRREDTSLYVRARIAEPEMGGISGEDVQVESITAEGNGQWSNEEYSSTTTDTFPLSQTALAAVTAVTNAGPTDGTYFNGSGRLIGEFRFAGSSPNSEGDAAVTGLAFTINQTGGVSLSNVYVRPDSNDERSDCSVTSSMVTCASIPSTVGLISSSPRVIRVYADVTVLASSENPSLRLVLNEPGNPTSAGAVTWTDGTTTFTWLPVSQPVAGGTSFK